MRFNIFRSNCKGFSNKIALLEKNPAKRLGVQSGGISDIKNHVFFKDVKWDMLFACTIRVPYKPKLTSEGDGTVLISMFIPRKPKRKV